MSFRDALMKGLNKPPSTPAEESFNPTFRGEGADIDPPPAEAFMDDWDDLDDSWAPPHRATHTPARTSGRVSFNSYSDDMSAPRVSGGRSRRGRGRSRRGRGFDRSRQAPRLADHYTVDFQHGYNFMIDIGSNLTCRQFKDQVHEVVDRAFKANVKCQIVTGTDMKNSRAALELCNDMKFRDILRCTVGIHPHNASQYNHSIEKQIREMLKNNNGKIVAVGETGLDYNRMNSTVAEQMASFEAHVQIAIEYGLPLFLHERDAHHDFLKVLDKYKGKLPKVVVHCFTGKPKELKAYLERDFYIGITGFIAIEHRSQALQKFVKDIPLNRLMIETDAPYMKPTGAEETPTKSMEPYLLGLVAKKLATLYKTSESNIIRKTTQNAIAFFNLSPVTPAVYRAPDDKYARYTGFSEPAPLEFV